MMKKCLRKRHLCSVLSVMLASNAALAAENSPEKVPPQVPVRDLSFDRWVATDALGRQLPLGGQSVDGTPLRAPRQDRFVGIFYFVWQGFHGANGLHDISKLLAQNPKAPQFGPNGAFHWWGEPEIGYFRAADPWVARRNLLMLGVAGVDVLFVDVTNAFTYPEEMRVLAEQARALRALGNPVPQIAFVLNAHTVPTLKRLWEQWYQAGKYRELWFQWQGKPLILADINDKTEQGETVPQEIKAFFTWRRSWFETDPKGWFGDGRDKWPWRDRTPQNFGWHSSPQKAEQIAVGVASHPIGENIGRSYQNKTRVKVNEFDSTDTFDRGIQFQEQWRRVWETDPEMVFITGWNEWVAQRFTVAPNQPINLVGRQLKTGDTFFVDVYNAEFSRDADPMKGGYTDNYYYQMIANIRRYKGARPLPVTSQTRSIKINDDFDQWQKVPLEFRDTLGDTLHRDFAGWGDLHYKNDSGRNDIATSKVAFDRNNLAFYARTQAPLSPRNGRAWMLLLLDTDRDAKTGWLGYDFRLNAHPETARTSLERWDNGAWKLVARVPLRARGNELHLSVPRNLVGQNRNVGFDFKWADNIDANGTVEEFFLNGDVAPPRRFNFRFLAANAPR